MASPAPVFLWVDDVAAEAKNTYAGFRGGFELTAPAEVEFRLFGASWFVAWLDGEFFAEGPARFLAPFPEYQIFRATLPAGRHVLAVQVHHIGESTRLLLPLEPFLHCRALTSGRELPIAWRAQRLPGYFAGSRRINPQLGFIEWCDTRALPLWQTPAFDDSAWSSPAPVARPLGPLTPLTTANCGAFMLPVTTLAAGTLVEEFGYERDNPAARFFLRELSPADLPPQGVWRRYDLGRVRLMRPRFTLDLPAGAVVEFAYAEALTRGRVAPWITLSDGDSCNLDHYVARGGPQEFFPLTPKGGRFLEVHVIAEPATVKFLREEIMERAYYREAQGSLHTGDALLDQIWSVGVETHRGCAEDAIVDNPTRERGEWAGDVVTVGMDIAAVAFADLRLCRRGLVQCAQCARDDGLVAGLCPGGAAYLSTYAAQWITACVHYWALTGDRTLLEEMFPFAERNLDAFAAQSGPDGVRNELGWAFVDWGYVRNPGPTDMALNLHYLAALRDMIRWCEAVDRPARAAHYRTQADALRAIIAAYYAAEFSSGDDAWSRIGYHRTALGLWLNFFPAADESAAVAFIKRHMLQCFPNDPTAPRLSDPAANNPRLITPYFGNYAMPLLIARGEMDFVLAQFRACWGWSLGGGRTTWLEVFDPRWSHCHQWAGCPTWQLSRFLLGLQPRADRGERHFDFTLRTGSHPRAEGTLPIAGSTDVVHVRWERNASEIRYTLESATPIHVQFPDAATPTRIAGRYERRWPVALVR
ncbi:hypothetical protein K0B96_04640 [Horticoccus luteus]|uniref:Alpha-L-rhamnosidase six-hairpin glycosidase domain-containing protein n=1 Tax=Horticoccus luteus TaxID=2862869 RepID=A0A8F9TXF6_9BACT|nr:hypothetical protein [Horticoccus luteus]QYM79910.1 hypothetical protein K0B96_04640 [Horticoccus luteus]